MKWIVRYTAALFLVSLSFQASVSQIMVKKSGGTNLYLIRELGAALTEKADTVSIMLVLPEDSRPEGYKEIVIKNDDQILMVNRNRIKSIADFEAQYNSVKIGETVKMGIRRDGQLLFVAFNKIDPEKLPKQKMMINLSEDGKSGGKQMTKGFSFFSGDKEMAGVQPLAGTGLLLAEENGKIVVKMKAQMDSSLNPEIKEGDEITALNGQKVASLEKLVSDYEKIKTGEKVELGCVRNGQQYKTVFPKPAMQGKTRIIKEEK